jgi:translation elongation factor EF-1beta
MSENTTPATAKVKKTATIPAADVDFGKVAKDVSDKWTATPSISLNWITATDFATNVTDYNTVLIDRKQAGRARPQKTVALKAIETQMDDALAYVKGYILEKYKKGAAASYYPAFGLVVINKAFVLPKDQNGRSEALNAMITAIDANGFGAKEFGTTFWTTIKTDYDNLLSQAKGTDTTVTEKVGDKKLLKTSIKKVLNALIGQIKSNYPDTYTTELRVWGFHKEKY